MHCHCTYANSFKIQVRKFAVLHIFELQFDILLAAWHNLRVALYTALLQTSIGTANCIVIIKNKKSVFSKFNRAATKEWIPTSLLACLPNIRAQEFFPSLGIP